MNRIRKLAEELFEKYPNLFSANFDQNKKALAQVSIIRSTSVRNQLAGAITSHVRDNLPESKPVQLGPEDEVSESSAADEVKEGNPEITQAAL